MRAVILGGTGLLGRALRAVLPDAAAPGRHELDVGDPDSVAAFDWSGVDTVLNAAAYTAVDRAETDRAAAWRANATGPALLARTAVRHDLTLVGVSTEYVFDGSGTGPVPESAPLAPVNAYGASKAAGEVALAAVPRHLVVRTSWLVGDGTNFVATMLGLATRGVCPEVVDDQVGRPTFAPDLARALVALAEAATAGRVSGPFHVTGGGDPVSWCGLARAVFAHAGRDPGDVRATTTAAYTSTRPEVAVRPANGVLGLDRLHDIGIATPDWPDALAAHLERT